MNAPAMAFTAVTTPNLFAEVEGRTLAYRSIGAGKPLVLCARFRGHMDVWDPLFLDALAQNGFQVITFDYTGLGLSSGEKSFNPASMAKDAVDLLSALELTDAVIAGWSLGGMAAQIAVAAYPDRTSHAVLIGTVPPGTNVKPAEQLFYDTACIPNYTVEDQTILFFEPASAESAAAARHSLQHIAQRTTNLSKPWPLDWSVANLGDRPRSPMFPADEVLQALKVTKIPLLHLGGDHDIVFPVENWFALNGQLPTLKLVTFPRAGHGPQHQYPQACAEHIASFVQSNP